jgi:transketolase
MMKHILSDCRTVFSLENHFLIGKQGNRIADSLTSKGISDTKFTQLSLNEIHTCGTKTEIFHEHGLDSDLLIKPDVKGIQQ